MRVDGLKVGRAECETEEPGWLDVSWSVELILPAGDPAWLAVPVGVPVGSICLSIFCVLL